MCFLSCEHARAFLCKNAMPRMCGLTTAQHTTYVCTSTAYIPVPRRVTVPLNTLPSIGLSRTEHLHTKGRGSSMDSHLLIMSRLLLSIIMCTYKCRLVGMYEHAQINTGIHTDTQHMHAYTHAHTHDTCQHTGIHTHTNTHALIASAVARISAHTHTHKTHTHTH